VNGTPRLFAVPGSPAPILARSAEECEQRGDVFGRQFWSEPGVAGKISSGGDMAPVDPAGMATPWRRASSAPSPHPP